MARSHRRRLIHIYFEVRPSARRHRQSGWREARRIAANIAELSEFLGTHQNREEKHLGKWDFIIEPLLRDLESEIADGPGPIRSNIDDKIREAEQIVSETGPRDINERPEDRVAAFLRELRRTLRQRLEQEPQRKVWHEAVLLLDIPRIRI